MIEETAKVVSSDDEHIVIEILKKSSCGSCSVNKACGTGIISNYFKPKALEFSIKNTINAKVGDDIIIGINERVFLFGSFLMYILPLFFILCFAVLGDYIASLAALSSPEIFVIVMSGTGFIFSFAFMKYLLKNKLNLLQFNPELIRKL
ncbi:MAG: SoxR reducing system RseC family protein [Gammaproteobacteria bacterium]